MANVYDKMKELGVTLPTPSPAGGVYTPVMEFGSNYLYCSGCGPNFYKEDTAIFGCLGRDVTLEEGQNAAKNCILNLLSNLENQIGDLNKIKRFVKILAFVASDTSFTQQPQVVNGGSQLLVDLFGEDAGKPARSAIGVNVLPGNIPVEIEVLVELNQY